MALSSHGHNAPTTHCLQCGAAVSLAAVLDKFGRCEACYASFTKGRNISAQLPPNAVVWAGYFPGFADDLTSWETVVRYDGSLTQTIRWYERVQPGRTTETLEAVVADADIGRLITEIEAIDRLGIAALRPYFMDDAATIFIVAPELGFHASLDLGALSENEQRPKVARNGQATFNAAWKTIESLSPYTLRSHRRKR